MINTIKETIWSQFGASIDMLINVISNCPEDYLINNKRFFYIAYHSTIFLDYYLTLPADNFKPLLPFTQKDKKERPKEAIDDLIPDRIYTKIELIEYLQNSRIKCKQLIDNLNAENLNDRFNEGNEPDDMDYPILEILLYNLRHTQHHAAQLNLMLRQDLNLHMEWSFKADDIK